MSQREINNHTNGIHEGTPRLVYQDNSLSFTGLLEKYDSAIHKQNLQILALKLLKAQNNMTQEIMKELLKILNPSYNICFEDTHLRRENVKTTPYCSNFVQY